MSIDTAVFQYVEFVAYAHRRQKTVKTSPKNENMTHSYHRNLTTMRTNASLVFSIVIVLVVSVLRRRAQKRGYVSKLLWSLPLCPTGFWLISCWTYRMCFCDTANSIAVFNAICCHGGTGKLAEKWVGFISGCNACLCHTDDRLRHHIHTHTHIPVLCLVCSQQETDC